MKALFARFAADDRGATAIEYGLIAAGIAVAITSSVNQLGCELSEVFNEVDAGLSQ